MALADVLLGPSYEHSTNSLFILYAFPNQIYPERRRTSSDPLEDGKMIPLLVALLIRLRMEGSRKRSVENSSGANQVTKSQKG